MSESEIKEYRDLEERIMHNSDEEFRAHYSMPGQSLMRDLVMGKKVYDTKDVIATHIIILYKIIKWILLAIVATGIGILIEPYIHTILYTLYTL